MGIAIARSRALVGLDAVEVKVEVHTAGGLPRTTIVGLPAAVVRESRDRVRSALEASGLGYPNGRVTINLAPAELPKEGGRFDLAIAAAVLAAEGRIPGTRLEGTEILGELSLDGTVQPVAGALPCAVASARAGRALLLPWENTADAARAGGAELHAVTTLLEARDCLSGSPLPVRDPPATPPARRRAFADLSEVRGQAVAKRALEIAAAGGHHLLMVGPPGTGKTMLASRLAGILPPMDEAQALETAAVYSVSRVPAEADWTVRPVRSPHHTTSAAGLIGGSARPRPGEISLAHNGVLFLDELGEFPRHVLDALREPLESGRVTVARAAAHVEYPARFQLVAAMNPCPCGYYADGTERCRCTPETVRRYQARVSGPLLDRIDLHLELNRVGRRPGREGPADGAAAATSAVVRARVVAAYRRQVETRGRLNRDLDEAAVRRQCGLDGAGQDLLETAVEHLELSERGVGRIRRVARTIADLAGREAIGANHVAEAIALRRLDRRE